MNMVGVREHSDTEDGPSRRFHTVHLQHKIKVTKSTFHEA